MNKPQWYVVDRLNSAVLCHDRQEAEEIVAGNMARYPFTGPWRVALMVEIDIPNSPTGGGQAAPAAAQADGADRAALAQAHRQARLHGPLESALSSPALATCLRNIVHAHQADPARRYDLATDGETVYILPPAGAAPAFIGVDLAAGPDLQAEIPIPFHSAVDRKRLAAGDDR